MALVLLFITDPCSIVMLYKEAFRAEGHHTAQGLDCATKALLHAFLLAPTNYTRFRHLRHLPSQPLFTCLTAVLEATVEEDEDYSLGRGFKGNPGHDRGCPRLTLPNTWYASNGGHV